MIRLKVSKKEQKAHKRMVREEMSNLGTIADGLGSMTRDVQDAFGDNRNRNNGRSSGCWIQWSHHSLPVEAVVCSFFAFRKTAIHCNLHDVPYRKGIMVSTTVRRRRRSVSQSSSSMGSRLLLLLTASWSLLLSSSSSSSIIFVDGRRLNMAADQSIVTEIELAHAIGNYDSLFTLHAEFVNDDNDDTASALLLETASLLLLQPMSAAGEHSSGAEASPQKKKRNEIAVHVREATPAITSTTTYSINNGNNDGSRQGRLVHTVNEKEIATMLVSDMEGILAFIAVEDNNKEGTTHGIIKLGTGGVTSSIEWNWCKASSSLPSSCRDEILDHLQG